MATINTINKVEHDKSSRETVAASRSTVGIKCSGI